MATILKNVVSFTGLVIGSATALPHSLNVLGTSVAPRLVAAGSSGFEVSADSTNVTVTRTNAAQSSSVEVYVEYWHSIESATPVGDLAGLTPFVIAQGISGESSIPSTAFVFQPGGTASGNVYTDWEDLVTALNTVDGQRFVQFDDSFTSPCVVPSGTWAMGSDVWWIGSLTTPVDVSVSEGATLTDLRKFDQNLKITFTGSTAPVSDFATADVVVYIGRGVEISCSGTGPFFDYSVVSATEAGVFAFDIGGRLVSNTNAVLNLSAAGAQIVFAMGGALCELEDDTLSGVAGSVAIIVIAASGVAGISQTQTAFLGTLQLANLSRLWMFTNDGVITSDTIITDSNVIVRVDPSASDVNITLPLAADFPGQWIVVKSVLDAPPNDIFVLPSGADTVDSDTQQTISTSFGSMMFVSDGDDNWLMVGAAKL